MLVDFGGAAFVRGRTRELVGFVGTKFFGAPECFKHGARHGAKSDVWSIGVSLLTILTGPPPPRTSSAARGARCTPVLSPPS